MESIEIKQKLIKGFSNDSFLKLKLQDDSNGLTLFAIRKYMPFSLYPTAYLKGQYANESGKNVVTIKVRPGWHHPLFVAGLIVFVLREFYLFLINSQDLATTIFVCFLCFFAFVINYILALGFSNNLKENLEDTLLLDESEITATNNSFMQ